MSYALLNGTLLPAADAAIPLADRGFRFGDGVFETMRLHRGVPYQWELHLARLRAGLAALRISEPWVTWEKAAQQLIPKHPDGFLRLSISRGAGSVGYLPQAELQPNWAMEMLAPNPPPAAPYRLFLSDLRKIPAECLPLNHKLAQGVNNTLALLEAKAQGCDEALQLTVKSELCEAASANIFWVIGGTCFTPALSSNCLSGTTRAAVMRLLEVEEVLAPLETLQQADAVFITNARLGVHPVAELTPMGWKFAAAHPMIQDLQQRLRNDYAVYTNTHAPHWDTP